ncbi:ketopantoate reductase family protein [Pseudonocardia nigra]|uniref:ketopantoate reductase family protein n=1 Tax=Pseudonocardia nigra TaxID=1921578 RepID=UPI001C5EAAFD|nr:2-dehydropantoate 2-reductase [Pseudonocardia nigra]
MDRDTGNALAPEDRAGLASLRVAVLGPGGVGGLLAGLLARAGATVTCLAGADTAAVLNRQGLRIDSGRFGSFTVPVRAAGRLAEPVDVCLVTVKATQLDTAAQRVPADVLGGALVVPLLNGVEHVALLRQWYPGAAVVAGTIRVESSRVAPAEIRHDSPFASIELAAGHELRDRVEQLAHVLQQAGLDVRVTEDEGAILWGKLNFLAPLALLTTDEDAPAGVVRERRREDLVAVIAEVAAVARAEGAPADEHGVLEFFDQVPASMQSSMQRDAAAGRPTELEAIGGAVVRSGATHGIPVPVTTHLVEQLRARGLAPTEAAR